MKHILKSTGQNIYPLEYIGQGVQPWPANSMRVLIPNQSGRNHIQIVRKDKIQRIATGFGEQE